MKCLHRAEIAELSDNRVTYGTRVQCTILISTFKKWRVLVCSFYRSLNVPTLNIGCTIPMPNILFYKLENVFFSQPNRANGHSLITKHRSQLNRHNFVAKYFVFRTEIMWISVHSWTERTKQINLLSVQRGTKHSKKKHRCLYKSII